MGNMIEDIEAPSIQKRNKWLLIFIDIKVIYLWELFNWFMHSRKSDSKNPKGSRSYKFTPHDSKVSDHIPSERAEVKKKKKRTFNFQKDQPIEDKVSPISRLEEESTAK